MNEPIQNVGRSARVPAVAGPVIATLPPEVSVVPLAPPISIVDDVIIGAAKLKFPPTLLNAIVDPFVNEFNNIPPPSVPLPATCIVLPVDGLMVSTPIVEVLPLPPMMAFTPVLIPPENVVAPKLLLDEFVIAPIVLAPKLLAAAVDVMPPPTVIAPAPLSSVVLTVPAELDVVREVQANLIADSTPPAEPNMVGTPDNDPSSNAETDVKALTTP